MRKRRGRVQRDVIRVLAEAGGELAVGELGRRVDAHRSNIRRAVRLLVGRGDVVQLDGLAGDRRLRLGARHPMLPALTAAMAAPGPEEPPRPSVAEVLAAVRRARREWEAEVPTFYRAGPEARKRELLGPGPIQRRVLAALWRLPGRVDGGLPAAAVVAIVGGDGGSVRRAVRSLLRAGRVERSECGRIRLSGGEAFMFGLGAHTALLEDPPDAERARAVMRRFGEEEEEGPPR